MRPTFGRKYIEDEFQRIAEGLTDPLTVYLIGGRAMSLRDIKGATKDIDLIVVDGDAYGQLWAVLMDLGYAEVQDMNAALEPQHTIGRFAELLIGTVQSL